MSQAKEVPPKTAMNKDIFLDTDRNTDQQPEAATSDEAADDSQPPPLRYQASIKNIMERKAQPIKR